MNKNEIIMKNEKYIMKVFHMYYNIYNFYGFEYDDLYQNALLFILENLDNYDSSKGKIRSYISILIKNSILKYNTYNSRLVSISNNYICLSNKLKAKNNSYYLENGSYMSINSMVEYLKNITGINCIDKKYIDFLLSIDDNKYNMNRLDLDDVYYCDEENKDEILVSDIVCSDVRFEEEILDKIVKENFIKYLKNLKINQIFIDTFIERYGLEDNITKTLYELADKYNLSYQAIDKRINSVRKKINKEKVKEILF